MCKNDEEEVPHLPIHCPLARKLWSRIFSFLVWIVLKMDSWRRGIGERLRGRLDRSHCYILGGWFKFSVKDLSKAWKSPFSTRDDFFGYFI